MTRGLLRTLAALAAVAGAWIAACRMDATHPDSQPAASGAARRVPIGGIQWYVDYDAALEIARDEDKALWVHFGENPG